MEYTCIRKCYFMDRLIKEDMVIDIDGPSENDQKMLARCFESDEPVKKKRTRKDAPKKVEEKLPDSPAPGFLE